VDLAAAFERLSFKVKPKTMTRITDWRHHGESLAFSDGS
jgi:hypothetical protein